MSDMAQDLRRRTAAVTCMNSDTEREMPHMTENPPQSTSELGRRSLLRKGMLTGLGVTALSIATPVAAMAAPRAATRTIKPAGPTSPTTVRPNLLTFQADWRFCTKCKGLFWSGDGSESGTCPAPAQYPLLPHTPGATNYGVPFGYASETGLQVGWRFCNQCKGLFWGPSVASSFCPATTFEEFPHTAGDTVYDMMVTGYWTGTLQSAWSYCIQCQGLFWGTDVAFSYCPNTSYTNHHKGTTDYSLID